MTEQLLNSVAGDAMARLRWKVLQNFGVLPCSKEAQSMTDCDCIEYALNMVLDGKSGEENPLFDSVRFFAMKEGRYD